MTKQFKIFLILGALILLVFTIYLIRQSGLVKTNPVATTETPTTSVDNATPTIDQSEGTTLPIPEKTPGDPTEAKTFTEQLAPQLYTFSYDDPTAYEDRIGQLILPGREDEIFSKVGPPSLDSNATSTHPGRQSIARLDTIEEIISSDTSANYKSVIKVVEVEGTNVISRVRVTVDLFIIHTADGWSLSAITFE